MPSAVRVSDGSFDFSQGVDSGKVPTLQSELTPNGLKRNQVAWMKNATCRGGGIGPRSGWIKRCRVTDGSTLYQGGWMYDASALNSANNPYLMLSIGGRIYQVRVDTNNAVVDISAAFGLTNPATVPQAFFCQGEEFMVIQAGDYATLPLFWDGLNLRRSVGLAPTGGLGGVTFAVPAIGQPVLITFAVGYTGPKSNEFVTVDGHTYQWIANTNRHTLTVSPYDASVHHYTFPVGDLITTVAGSTGSGTFLVAVNTDNNTPTTIFCSGTFVPNLHPYVDANTSSGGAQLLANSLGVPAANQEWFLNIDDPRAGQTITTMAATEAELPPAGPMDYYMGRLWYAQGRQYAAGDIVRGANGSGVYGFRDAILKVTENPLAVGGDGFSVPSNSGDITALNHTTALDAAMGDGPLLIFTPKSVYQLVVPVSRTAWQAATAANMPLQTVAQRDNGTPAERSVVSFNGDLFYKSKEGWRSLITALRYFGQWGNTPISNNVQRAIQFEDANLNQFQSGIVFDNRLLLTCLPEQTAAGVVHKGILPLDFDIISTLDTKLPPAWEGMDEGLEVLQLFVGNFSGQDKAFAVVVSAQDGGIDVWELTLDNQNDQNDARVIWYTETPAWTWGKEFQMHELDGGEIWIDRLRSTVELEVMYRVDADPCWNLWHREKLCSAQSSCEDCDNPVCYPEQPYQENYKFPVTLPKPPYPTCQGMNKRPVNKGYQFQVRVAVKGFCRIRGIIVHAIEMERAPYEGLRG